MQESLPAVPQHTRVLTASRTQRRLWRALGRSGHRLERDLRLVNLVGPLDVDALETAIHDLVRTHQSLRTTHDLSQDALRIDAVPTISLHQSRSQPASGTTARAMVRQAVRDLEDATGPGVPLALSLVAHAADTHILILASRPDLLDDWSLGTILEDLAGAYSARVGAESWTPRPAPTLVEFLGSLDDAQEREAETRDAEHWVRALDGVRPATALPLLPAPAPDGAWGADAPVVTLDAELVHRLRTRCAALGVSLFSGIAGIVGALTARARGVAVSDIAIPSARQQAEEWSRLVGAQTSHLPVRLTLPDDATLEEIARAAQIAVLEASEHSTGGIEALCEALDGESAVFPPPIGPLVRVAVDPDPVEPNARWRGLDARVECVRHSSPFALCIDAQLERGALTVRAPFDPAQLHRESVERWLAVLPTWVAALADASETSIDALPLMSATDEQRMVGALNDAAAVDWEDALLVHELVSRQAERTPSTPAVTFEGRTLTYAALEDTSNRLAHHLRGLGVGRNVLVGLCLDRSVELVVGVLAVLKAGGAYLPVDPEQPDARLRGTLADASPSVLLTQATLRDRVQALAPGGSEVLALDADAARWDDAPTTPPAALADADSLAYVIYTSGSTGTPKGAEILHRGFGNHVRWVARQLAAAPSDRLLQKTTIAFDAAVWDFFTPLITGGTLVLAAPGGHRDPAYLVRTLIEQGITIFQLVPSALREFVRTPGLERCRSLRYVVCGGEALDRSLVRQLYAVLPGIVVANFYGPTEGSNVTTFHELRSAPTGEGSVPIGRPAANVRVYVLDAARRPVPPGCPGELYIGGSGVARGYHNRPDLTAERFLADPWVPGGRLYRSGDRVVQHEDGTLEFLGRVDAQVKIRGHRIEPAEVESAISRFAGVRECAVLAVPDPVGDARLVAFVVGESVDVVSLRAALAGELASYMVPAVITPIAALPLLPNGKLDRAALPAVTAERPALAVPYATPATDAERTIAGAFEEVLGLRGVGRDDNFFELGGSSLSALRVLDTIASRTGQRISVPTLFAGPTPRHVALAMQPATMASRDSARVAARDAARRTSADPTPQMHAPIAVIGMAGRFPGAGDVEALWEMLAAGRDGITDFTDLTLDASVPADDRARADYVKARGILADADRFDAAFFGIPMREAQVMDPQHRVFLEIAWECLERAGYAPDSVPDVTGVFAGVGPPTYLRHNVLGRPDVVRAVGDLLLTVGNDKDYVAMRVANRLDLRGPAVNVNTACSTSLVAVALAVDSLRAGRCRLALAGGANVHAPIATGYLYEEGAMLSPDARTRAFDADARGTSFNDGAAVVLLKRLDDALADGDTVHAVIRGIGINNDGGQKASFTAPSVDGQAAVIAAAHADADVRADSISYVEAHGTATPLGDPVEVEALTRAFRRSTDAVGFCRIGSVKSNVGHLVAAAGATGLIKTVLALSKETLPPTIHLRRPNPLIPFATSPFAPVATATAWPRTATPRRAGVSSFGVGGTNAHVVVEEAPAPAVSAPANGTHLLRLSARSADALARMQERLAVHLRAHPETNLADAAFTLHTGRSAFAHRAVVAASTTADAADALARADSPWRAMRTLPPAPPGVVLLFPGQGAQYAGMGRGLYEFEPAFRAAFDECCDAVAPVLGADLRDLMFRGEASALQETAVTQPATFCVEYATARWWMAHGLRPQALIGHSVGEFVAAALAGVIAPADAARLVARRGQLMQALPAGGMLSVRLSARAVEARLPSELSLAAENGPEACVVSGPHEALQRFAAALERDAITARTLVTSHAFHSAMMDPAVEAFRAEVARVALSVPEIPIVSTVTGSWLSEAQATDPGYWARHLRVPVRFSSALRTTLARGGVAFVEVGPRGTLATLARQHRGEDGSVPVAVASLGDHPDTEQRQLMLAAGTLWTLGVSLETTQYPGRRRITLPTYPFARTRVWLDPEPSRVPQAPADVATHSRAVDPASDALPIGAAAATALASLETAVGAARPLREQVIALLEELAGLELRGVDGGTPFVELGLDSLTLTQAAQRVKKVFGVQVTFRELMERYRSVDALAAHLGELLPTNGAHPPVPTEATTPATPAPDAVATPAPASSRPLTYDVKQAFGAIARIHRDANTLTDRQQARLDAFVRRYVERTQRSKEYTAKHRSQLADPRIVNGFRPQLKEIIYQLVIDRSAGARMWDLDGNEYIDALGGFGMCLFGWQPEFVQQAVRAQLERGYDIGPMHPLAAEVAELICELTGCERAALVNTGSEAVMGAIRMARTVTARGKIVTFAGSYHGTFDEVLVRAGKDRRGIPAVPGVMPTMFGDIIVLEYGAPESLETIRALGDELAAVVVEPVQSRRPEFQPREFVQQLRAVTEAQGTCLIFDEVITGFRSHLRGAQELFGVRADLVTYGKVIGGGMPIGVIAGTRSYMDAIDGGSWQYGDDSVPSVGVTYLAGTFVRHPLALAAAKASLEHLRDAGPALQEGLNARIAGMVARMNAHARRRSAPVEVRSFASLWRITFTEEHPWQDLLFAMMRSRGIHILDNFPCYGTTALTDADLAAIAEAFEASVDEMQESGFLPGRGATESHAMDPAAPPVAGARLGRDEAGRPAWFVPHPEHKGRYVKLDA